MADSDLLDIIHQGIDVWNNWKRHNIWGGDLSEANFQRADLGRVDFINMDLQRANFSWANLSDAYLNDANLSYATINGANLHRAHLKGADLRWADLQRADLSEADLFEAYLSGANLYGAYLSEADLSGANLSGAELHGSNLSRAKLRAADIAGANLGEADLREVNLRRSNLSSSKLHRANLVKADLYGANLRYADLSETDLHGANLSMSDLSKADLNGANLIDADLKGTDLNEADLHNANLSGVKLVETNLERADLTNCKVYGISTWGLKLKGAKQNNLIITPPGEPEITVDNLEVAQFIYLLLHNEKIREVIDTITSKVVLILGRFTPERKAVLDALRNELRNRSYLPIIFDFEKPSTKDFTETIRILAGMSLFVIADISNPKSSPLELQATVPDYMVPFVPIIQEGEKPFSMFRDLYIQYKKWVLKPLEYDSPDGLIKVLDKAIIEPALQVHSELLAEKAAELPRRHVKDYLTEGL